MLHFAPQHLLSVVIPAGDDIVRLRWCLEGLKDQESPPRHEIIVVDDGNGGVSDEVARSGISAVSVYMGPPSREFRAAAARNLGVLHSSGEQLTFVDADVVVDRDYLRSIHRCYEPGVARYTFRRRLPINLVSPFSGLNRIWLLDNSEFMLADHVTAGTTWPSSFSFTLSTEDFCACGGFDERFVGWGHEDNDLFNRLSHRGIKIKPLVDRAWCVHLDHRQRGSSNSDWKAEQAYSRFSEYDGVRNGGRLIRLCDRPNV